MHQDSRQVHCVWEYVTLDNVVAHFKVSYLITILSLLSLQNTERRIVIYWRLI